MTWWHYLLLANLYLTLFFVFYTLFLRKETFFNLNRIYLVSASLLSFFIPGIQSAWIQNLFITQKVQETIYHVSPQVMYEFNVTATPSHQFTMGQLLVGIYLTGMLVLSIRFVYQLILLKRVIKKSETTSAYSFFNNIKLEEHQTGNQIITAHEQAHARQWHSADILLLEAIMIINWFNPVVYLYRNAIKHIHEFIADRDALKAGTDKAEYAMLLLSQTFTSPPHQLVNPFFNHSMLKQRILMLQKNKSHRTALIKYGLSAPLFALMLILSSATVNNSKTIKVINKKAEEVFLRPAALNALGQSTAGEIDLQKDREVSDGSIASAKEDSIYSRVEKSAQFPGGLPAFANYLSHNVRYTAEAKRKGLQGKVFVTFVVEKSGVLSSLKILRGIGGGLDEEAIRVLAASPAWRPGMQDGKPVRQQYTLPIAFTLNDVQSARDTGDQLFSAVENSAEFPGGINAFFKYISGNIHYPDEAREKHIQGKVIATFVVEKDGSVNTIKILRGIGGGADEETIRLLSNMPKWKPGIQNGHVVRQQYTVPISFTLVDNAANTGRAKSDTGRIFSAVEHSAEFNGGLEAFFQYLAKAIHYPAEARQKNVQGKVFITFVVEKDGTLTNMRILRDPGAGLGAEALRVMAQSPRWKPGTQNGIPVREQYTVPISFTLSDSKPASKADTLLKKAQLHSNGSLQHRFNSNTLGVPDTSQNHATLTTVKHSPLYVIDNKIVDKKTFASLASDDISSMYIFKDTAAINRYGSRGAFGAITVVTRRNTLGAGNKSF